MEQETIENSQSTSQKENNSLSAIANKRPSIPLLFALVFVLFFFTFCEFRCQNQTIGSVTGFNLVTGTELKDRDLFSGRETKGEKIPASIWAILAFSAAIIGAGTYLIKEKKDGLIGTGAASIGFISLVILQFVAKDSTRRATEGTMEVVFQFSYWLALIVLGVAGYLSYLRLNGSGKNKISLQSVNPTPGYTIPKIPTPNIKLPKIKWSEIFSPIKLFLIKYKIHLMIGIGALIAFYIVYVFFIKADPVKDGKKFAKNYCACTEELDKSNLATMQSFLNDFDNKKYKSRIEARTALINLMQTNQTKYSSCTQQADLKYKEKYADYNGTGGRNIQIFEQTYNSLIGSCGSNINTDFASVQNKIDTKINTIIDPEPDIEKIKADLIGSSITGWNFYALAEFDKTTISNTSRAADRIEFTIDLHLIDFNSKAPHDAQIIVTYTKDENGWSFDGVKEVYITYTYSLQTDNWLSVTLLANSTYSIQDNGQKYWIQEGSYGEKYKGGGTDNDQFYLHSSQINLMSREDHPIEVIIRFAPN